MGRKTIRFLIGSVSGIFVLCIVVFVGMFNHMNGANEAGMREVCRLYMSEMSHQIQTHFQADTDLLLDMEEAIIRRYPPENVSEYSGSLVDELAFAARIRNFEFAALYSENGDMDIVYGDYVEIVNEEPFLKSLRGGEEKLVAGVTESGDMLLLFGHNASYPMQSGERSLALIVGLPIEYINDAMSLNQDKSLVYSHVIRRDGSFVLRNDNNSADNYFDWLLSEGTYEDQTSEQAVGELKTAIANEKDYSVVVTVDRQRRDIYCEPLKKTEWVLVTVMLHGTLDAAVYNLGISNQRGIIIACTLILFALLCLYIAYFRISLKQMKHLELARHEAVQASRARSQFLSNMSHDIRTPMNAIIGMTFIATANVDKPEIVQDCLRKLSLSSKHLLSLINDILDMSKLESGKLTLSMKEISLREVFESIVSIITPQIKEKNQNFDIFIHDIQSENVFCDDVRLNQVLINLLSNAVKFTPEEGSVYITLLQEDSPRGEKYVRTHIRVKDSGIGMCEEFSKTLFRAFERENNEHVHRTEGTGLGMAITKRIVDKMQGMIEVHSEQGRGTEFHVTLDLEKAQVAEEELRLPAWSILVVDDDEQMCRSAVENLKGIGIQAEWAQSGEAAIGMVEKHHEEKRDYQIVLLDWKMPVMDGIETAKKMRQRVGQDVPILMISAYDWSDVEEEARAAGVRNFIPKPLFKSTLYYGLSAFMDEESAVKEVSVGSDFDGGDRRLLVAEDYDMNWEIMETLLPEYGFLLERAENGQVCVDKFKASEEGYYSAILMDLRMPVMNGYEATKEIRNLKREDAALPIIAMTADAFSDDISRCLECGMNAHVAKPIDMRELLSVLKKSL